jgi:F-type H+-transporting ATPase subunit epsilon
MAETSYDLEIVAPDRQLYAGPVVSLVAPGVLGSFGVLAHHAPMISSLGVGELRLREPSGLERSMALRGGFFEVSGGRAIVLADGGEWQEEIDLARAEKAYQRALDRLMGASAGGEPMDRERARRASERARLRIRIARATMTVRR